MEHQHTDTGTTQVLQYLAPEGPNNVENIIITTLRAGINFSRFVTYCVWQVLILREFGSIIIIVQVKSRYYAQKEIIAGTYVIFCSHYLNAFTQLFECKE